MVAARAARRPLQRLGRQRRLLPRRDDLEPAHRPLAVRGDARRQHPAGAVGADPAHAGAADRTPRGPARARGAARPVPGQAARAPAGLGDRARPRPAAHRVAGRLLPHRHRRRGRPAPRPTRPPDAPAPTGDPDATYVKPITVIPASGPRASRIESERPPAPGRRRRPRARSARAPASSGRCSACSSSPPSSWCWRCAAVARRSRPRRSTPRPVRRHRVEQGALQPAPEVEGRAAGQRVTFTWRAADRAARRRHVACGVRTDTGEGDRTTEPRGDVRSADRVCVQVQLIRGARHLAADGALQA